MTPEQALSILQQVLVTKIGLDIPSLQTVLQAWQTLEVLVKFKDKKDDDPH
jgi:hypothetical protein